MGSRKPPKTTMSSQNVSTLERRPNLLKRAWRAPICVLFPAPSIPEKLTILNPRSLSIFSSPQGDRETSVSTWWLAGSGLSEGHNRSHGRARPEDGSDPDGDHANPSLFGGSDGDSCRLRSSDPARLGRFCGGCSHRLLRGGLRRSNSLRGRLRWLSRGRL